MSLIVWSEALSVGIDELDRQHQALFAIMNELHAQMLVGKGNNVIRPTLSRLIGYTKTHFAIEENLFKTHDYPAAAIHTRQHDDLTAKVLSLQSDLADGGAAVTVVTMQFLRDWLTTHILEEDMRYKPFLLARGVR